jgi:integrase
MQTRIDALLKFAADGVIRGKKNRLAVVHHAAMSPDDVPTFMRDLDTMGTVESRALSFTILTAGRTDEILGATWGEIDKVDNAPVWIIPPERMKAERQHRVPLTPEMLALLGERGADRDYLFPRDTSQPRSNGTGRPRSENRMGTDKLWYASMREVLAKLRPNDGLTVHGFRSSFRDWVGTKTEYSRDLAEWSLAHAVGSTLERSYARADLLEKRRPLMAAWCAFALSARP